MNWAYGAEAGVHCPVCSKITSGLDWVLDAFGEELTGAKVYPCLDVIPIPPYQFGPQPGTGELKFTQVQ